MSDLYQEIILEAAQHPSHQGELTGVEPIEERNASCGDQLSVYLKQDEQGKITDLKWQGQGCAISMASMSLLAEKIIDEKLTMQQISALTRQDLVEMLGLEQISPGRIKCLELGWRAVQKNAKG